MIAEYTCPGCGEACAIPDGPLTHVSVTRHDQDAAVDFAVSVCADCAAEVLPTLARWRHEAIRARADGEDVRKAELDPLSVEVDDAE